MDEQHGPARRALLLEEERTRNFVRHV
jgi:hypothetical protein